MAGNDPSRARDLTIWFCNRSNHYPAKMGALKCRLTSGIDVVLVLLVCGVQAGQCAVSGYVGERFHLASETVGLFLALSSIAGFVGAIVSGLTRNPARRAHLVNVGFYLLTPILTGLLTRNDPDGVLGTRTIIVAMLGAGVRTVLAAELFVRGGPAPVARILRDDFAHAASHKYRHSRESGNP